MQKMYRERIKPILIKNPFEKIEQKPKTKTFKFQIKIVLI